MAVLRIGDAFAVEEFDDGEDLQARILILPVKGFVKSRSGGFET